MVKCSRNMLRILRVIEFVLMLQVAVACASIPDERDGLLGRFLLASQTQVESNMAIKTDPESVSYVQPVDDNKPGKESSHGSPDGKPQNDLNIPVAPISTSSLGFIHAFAASISVIIVSELGDKTFFIAAIMSMRHSRVVVFTGAIMALGLMTILSAVVGFATTVIPRKFTLYISTALFVFFGLKMLKEGYDMNPNESQEELEEVQAELKQKEAELEKEDMVTQDPETGIIRGGKRNNRYIFHFLSPILFQSFTLTFLAEWGDRSQLATILLGARENVIGVILGGTLGHALCTGLAVIGGRFIAQRISVRTVTILGGFVFLIFALSAFFLET